MHGRWEQTGSVIKTRIEQEENGSKATYELVLVANKTGVVHSAIEFRNGTPNAYFKMIHFV
jgi:hypothetical protein